MVSIGLETTFIGLCLQGFFYGLYTAIFAMYLEYYAARENTCRSITIIFYAHSTLYVFTVATFALNIAITIIETETVNTLVLYYIYVITIVIYGFCDFISQAILVYRCWIVWGYNTYVVIIPAILIFAFLPIWLSIVGSVYIANNQLATAKQDWAYKVVPTCLGMSLTVNALVTGLIAFRIVKVYCQVKPILYGKMLGTSSECRLRSIVFIVIESAMVLFAFQVVWVVCTIVKADAASDVINVIVGTHQMLIGITPTIIQVRVSMGLSFHDEKSMVLSMVEGAGSVHFTPDNNNPDSNSEIVSENRHDGIGFRRSIDIEVVER
ncbi:hypothetical protein BYT27DRAFT_7340124 [Phlegmacium glaucopus]|nr:hypothetical protein BYT27DRAFT_7340124 [Phlegmacium glaucopus]